MVDWSLKGIYIICCVTCIKHICSCLSKKNIAWGNKRNPEDNKRLSMPGMAGSAIAAFMFYRIISAARVYLDTRKWYRNT